MIYFLTNFLIMRWNLGKGGGRVIPPDLLGGISLSRIALFKESQFPMRRIFLASLFCLFAAAPTQAAVIFSSDFESDQGGFTGTGDWERGIPTGFAGGFGSVEPVGGFSGDYAWGTVIGGDHSASTVSNLSQVFDLTGTSNASLSFNEWSQSGGNTFDMAQVLVNGNVEYLSDGDSGGTAWRPVNLDLSAYDGLSSVTIDFQFTTTTVVERVGWYIDDVEINGDTTAGPAVPEPSSIALCGLGAIMCAFYARRRNREIETVNA